MSQKENELAASVHLEPIFRPLVSVGKSRTVAAFPGLEIVGEYDDVLKQPLEVTMMEDWAAYLNAHVMMVISQYYTGRITAFRFAPDPENSQIIFIQANNLEEYGATEVRYVETESGAQTNLRLPMQRLGVKRHKDRVWSFPLVIRKGADGKEYLAITLVGATTRPAVKKKKTQAGAAATSPAPGGTAAPAPAPVVAAPGGDAAPAAQAGSSKTK